MKHLLCRLFGHPLSKVQLMTWHIEGSRQPGFICARCYGVVETTWLSATRLRQYVSTPSREYRLRQEQQARRELYREAARRLFPAGKVSEHSHVSESIDGDGAFVEVVVWVPKVEITDEIPNR